MGGGKKFKEISHFIHSHGVLSAYLLPVDKMALEFFSLWSRGGKSRLGKFSAPPLNCQYSFDDLLFYLGKAQHFMQFSSAWF